MDVRFGPKVGQIGPKWDKSGTYSDQAGRLNLLKYDLKFFWISQSWG